MNLVAAPWQVAALAFEELAEIPPRWQDVRRPNQVPPPLWEEWFTWLILAGRGWGKTRVGAETVAEWMRRYPGCRVALVAATFADGRDTMVEGESGLLSVLALDELRGGTEKGGWNRSHGELFLANGSRARIYFSVEPGRLRGPQHHFAWCDELAEWKDSDRDPSEIQTTWSNLTLGLRLRIRRHWPSDYQPRIIVTTTPKPVRLLRVSEDTVRREPQRAGLTQLPVDRVRITTGSTYENLDNLADVFRRAVVDPLKGTRLAEQELEAKILGDVQGALLSQLLIDRSRVLIGEVPGLALAVTAVDPATTAKDTSDETGIITVGMGADELYVLDDASGRHTPDEWGTAAWSAALDHGSQALVVEDNAGGDMVETVLLTTWAKVVRARFTTRGLTPPTRPPILRVHPSGEGQGKWARAQPIRLLYEQERVHHVRDATRDASLAQLEEQLTTWTGKAGEKSPDRVDALVHGASWMMFPALRANATAPGRGPGRHPGSRTR